MKRYKRQINPHSKYSLPVSLIAVGAGLLIAELVRIFIDMDVTVEPVATISFINIYSSSVINR